MGGAFLSAICPVVGPIVVGAGVGTEFAGTCATVIAGAVGLGAEIKKRT